MKRFAQILVVLVLIYALVGFLLVPNILKDEITKNAENVLKRKVSLHNVSFNPFNFEMRLEQLIIHSKGEGRTLAGVKALVVNVDPIYLVLGKITISEVLLQAPFLTLHKDKNGKLNFTDLLQSESNTSQSTSEKSELPKIVLQRFAIRQGKVNFIDETGSKTFSETLRPINFTLRDFSTMQEHKNQLSLHIEIDDGTYVDYRGKINRVEPLAIEGDVALHSGRLYTQWKYFQDQLGFIVADGALDASLSYSADFAPPKAKIYINQYKVNIDRLRLQDKQSRENILKMPSLHLEGEADVSEKRLKVENLAIKDFSIKAKRDQEGEINWLNYLPNSKAAPQDDNSSTENSWSVEVSAFDFGMVESSFEEHYAPQAYVSSLGALKLSMKDIIVNAEEMRLPLIRLDISKLQVQALDAQKSLPFKIEEVTLEGEAALKNQEVNISRLTINALEASISRDKQGKFSYEKYIPNQDKDVPKRKESTFAWELKALELNDAHLLFKDDFDAVHGITRIDQCNMTLNNLSSREGSWASSELNMVLNRSAKLSATSKIRQTPLKVQSQFKMEGFPLKSVQAYVNKNANMDINDGKMDLDFTLKHTPKQTKILANMQMLDLNLSERREGKPFFTFSKLVVKDIDFSLHPDQLKVAKVDIYEPYARIKIDQNQSTNLQNLSVKRATSEEPASSKPFVVFIGKVNFKDGTGEFSDLSLPLPFKTDIHDLNGEMIGLGTLSDIKSRIDLDGTVDEYGLMKVEGSLLSANPKHFTDMGVRFENIDMTNLSPYTGKFIGYKLKEGKMNVDLDYKINASQMQGANRIILKRMNLGDEVESEEAISAPVGLAIALLKDSDGVIDLDVPVSGDVDAPEFAIGHVVWTAFKNLIVGVATAPFRFLADTLGISEEELENIQFERGEYALLPPQKETLDKLAKALGEKKMLLLKVAGSYDNKGDRLAMQTAMVYQKALETFEDKTMDISKIDREQLDALLQKSYMSYFTQEKLDRLKESIDEKDIPTEAKEKELRESVFQGLIQAQKVSQEELQALAKRRAQSIISYLVSKGIAADRLSLELSVEVDVDTKESKYIPTRLELGAK